MSCVRGEAFQNIGKLSLDLISSFLPVRTLVEPSAHESWKSLSPAVEQFKEGSFLFQSSPPNEQEVQCLELFLTWAHGQSLSKRPLSCRALSASSQSLVKKALFAERNQYKKISSPPSSEEFGDAVLFVKNKPPIVEAAIAALSLSTSYIIEEREKWSVKGFEQKGTTPFLTTGVNVKGPWAMAVLLTLKECCAEWELVKLQHSLQVYPTYSPHAQNLYKRLRSQELTPLGTQTEQG